MECDGEKIQSEPRWSQMSSSSDTHQLWTSVLVSPAKAAADMADVAPKVTVTAFQVDVDLD
jgi:hypothetical protein